MGSYKSGSETMNPDLDPRIPILSRFLAIIQQIFINKEYWTTSEITSKFKLNERKKLQLCCRKHLLNKLLGNLKGTETDYINACTWEWSKSFEQFLVLIFYFHFIYFSGRVPIFACFLFCSNNFRLNYLHFSCKHFHNTLMQNMQKCTVFASLRIKIGKFFRITRHRCEKSSCSFHVVGSRTPSTDSPRLPTDLASSAGQLPTCSPLPSSTMQVSLLPFHIFSIALFPHRKNLNKKQLTSEDI